MSTPNDREFDLIDQMLSMHSSLRDIYARRTLVLNCTLLVASILLNAFVFVGDETLRVLGSDSTVLKFYIGAASVAVFVISILELRFDWAGTCRIHEEAAARLAELKLAYRQNYKSGDRENPETLAKLSLEYERVVGLTPAIPERHFTRLKHRHCKKRRLSEYISRYPGAPFFLLRCKIAFDAFRAVTRRAAKNKNDASA